MVFMPGALDHLDRIAARHPNLKLVLDHVGLRIHRKGPQAFDDLPAVCALAKHPNLAVKASGLPALSTERYPFRDVQPYIRTLVDAFGPRRTFWGTDLTRMPCTYYGCITLLTEHLPWLQGDDLAWVMGRGGLSSASSKNWQWTHANAITIPAVSEVSALRLQNCVVVPLPLRVSAICSLLSMSRGGQPRCGPKDGGRNMRRNCASDFNSGTRGWWTNPSPSCEWLRSPQSCPLSIVAFPPPLSLAHKKREAERGVHEDFTFSAST